MLRFRFIFSIPVLLLALCGSEQSTAQQPVSDAAHDNPSRMAFSLPTYDFLRDTVFLLDSVYLEVRLDKQVIIQHFRSGKTKRFSCSTGNPRLPEAIATREGIFSVQWKSQRYMSQQFEVWLNYWMPFDGGIGFHGLDGRSYYKYLGRRPSSHGCVRISNETGRDLFATVPRGTVVYVHNGNPARVLHFADSGTSGLRILSVSDNDLLSRRLEAVMQGRADDPALRERLVLPQGAKEIRSIAVGRANRGMRVQYTGQPIHVSLLEPQALLKEPDPIQVLSPLPSIPRSSNME